ncbi:MAG: FkbM family methyltransferase [Moorea sp. SIO1F2]|uniref:FkbM family methyltransferase n=1 Tax=Moorena sp. SIO1F2 TaxID=2607819 RepID=UPI0013B65D04|nr:FkbM family methyltransferase [Moorena sp. SIO1F2]NET86402.1 FkbM family methyltransferase [Moorena sp. SIO1F2]
MDENHIARWNKLSDITYQKVVETVTLNEIIDRYNTPKEFDLLSIDVEGHDFQVLASLDLDVYHPKIIIIEIHDFNLANPNKNQIYNYLLHSGYKMVSYSVPNGYFVRNCFW